MSAIKEAYFCLHPQLHYGCSHFRWSSRETTNGIKEGRCKMNKRVALTLNRPYRQVNATPKRPYNDRHASSARRECRPTHPVQDKADGKEARRAVSEGTSVGLEESDDECSEAFGVPHIRGE